MGMMDVRMVALPSHLREGFRKWFEGIEAMASASRRQMISARMGERLLGLKPTFGHVRAITEQDVVAAREAPGIEACPPGERDEFVRFLHGVDPSTPVCDACGVLLLQVEGGAVTGLPLGHLCPTCKRGKAVLIPFRLRKLAWSTGRLVEPQAETDALTVPGHELPLTDEGIRAWCGGRINRALDRRLEEEGLPLYLFLAFLFDVQRTFSRPEEAPTLLDTPAEYDLTGETLESAILEALAFGNEREIWNVPKLTRRAFLARHRQPDAPTWMVGGRPYLVEGQIGSGDHSHVFRATALHEPCEVVIIKTPRVAGAEASYERARSFLRSVPSFDSGATAAYARRIHQPLPFEACLDQDGVRVPALVFQDKPGYLYNGYEVRQAYPRGVPREAFAWLAKRAFELLAWLHQCNWAHGAPLPEHFLILPQDHMLTLIDCSYAGPLGTVVADCVPGRELFLPDDPTGARHTRSRDVTMTCRSLLYLLGADLATGELPPDAIDDATEFVRAHAGYGPVSPLRITDTMRQIHDPFLGIVKSLKRTEGRPDYVPFYLPPKPRG